MTEEQGQGKHQGQLARRQAARRSQNPLIKDTPADTIEACHEFVEYLQLSGEDLHPGLQLSHGVLREALGSLVRGAQSGGG